MANAHHGDYDFESPVLRRQFPRVLSGNRPPIHEKTLPKSGFLFVVHPPETANFYGPIFLPEV